MILAWALSAGLGLGAAAGGDGPITLEDVLASTERHYPPLLAAIQEVEQAEGASRAADGKFDTRVRLGGAADQFGFYENYRIDLGLEQSIQWWGAKLYAGWRLGEGGFAPYSGLQETRTGGEYRAGIKLPLLRGRSIDDPRARQRQATIGVNVAELSVMERGLVIRQLATDAYWDWVAAGRSLEIAQNLLAIAVSRDEYLRESVEAGALAAVEVIDNRRAILKRRSEIVSAERKLRKAAIYLSLYYRDRIGEPIVAPESRLPSFPVPGLQISRQLDEDLRLALLRRPELQSIRAESEQVGLDESLASNSVLPSLDLALGVTAESGVNPDVKRGPSDLKAGVVFSLPIQRREATGKQLKARAKLQQLRLEEKFLEEKIEAEVRDARVALETSYEKTQLLEEEVVVTRELEALERDRFDLGDSNLFTVNLREAATADAERRRVEALASYHRARGFYRLVIAEP